MTATAEPVVPKPVGFGAASLNRPLRLWSCGTSLSIDPEGAVRSLFSLREKRALFGFEQVWFYKVQAGIVVRSQKPGWEVIFSPREVRYSGRAFDMDVIQSLAPCRGEAQGFVRRVWVRNAGRSRTALRILELIDPTAAHFPDQSAAWGSLGVNAFNRGTYVAMDEVSSPPSARVVGSSPPPSRIYMTGSRQGALQVISSGEPPEPTAGTSGQVLVISARELELSPGESKELEFASVYNPGKLEDALSDFRRLVLGPGEKGEGPELACSDAAVTEAAAWALALLQAGAFVPDPLDRYESLRALSLLYPGLASVVVGGAEESIRKDGSLPHSLDWTKPGPLETAVFLRAAALAVLSSEDKKRRKPAYALVKKCAAFLIVSGTEAEPDPTVPQGWRRKLGTGYPAGEVPEVALAIAAGLEAASAAARLCSKPGEAARFLERSSSVSERVRKRSLEDHGLRICGGDGETVDLAVAAYRHPFMKTAEQGVARRLLERDFDTPYGPRCVPTTNSVCFNSTYGEGQLGGVWTRAALAHALVCYRTGLAASGGMALAKVVNTVVGGRLRLAGVPGEFPLWVDPDRREAHGGPDPVAAARFVEVLLEGELGLKEGEERVALGPAQASFLRWLSAADVWIGSKASAFLGRNAGAAHVFYSGERLDSESGMRFDSSERLEPPCSGVHVLMFYGPGQVICAGSTNGVPTRFTLSFAPRAAGFTKRLSTPLEEYDPTRGAWTKVGTLRVSQAMGFEARLDANGWKAYRVSTD